jgi:hypothetical protein
VPYCSQCSIGSGGARRAPNGAVWLAFLVSGVAELACERHAQMAFDRGGFGWRLTELPLVTFSARPTPDQATVIAAARPVSPEASPQAPVRRLKGVHSAEDRLAYSLGMRLLELIREAGSGGSG